MARQKQTGHALVIKTLALPETEVRTTPDKRVSVHDAITAVTGAKNPRDLYARLCDAYPEVVAKCDSFKFPGRGQQSTPVTNKQGLVYLFSLLPGTVGHDIREDAATLIVRYIEGDPTLAEEMIDRQEDPATLQRLALRAEGKGARLLMTSAIQAHGGESSKHGPNTYRVVTSMLNKAVMKNNSTVIQQYTGERATRDGLPDIYLGLLKTAEQLFAHKVTHDRIYGHMPLVATAGTVAKTMEDLCREYHVPPFPPS